MPADITIDDVHRLGFTKNVDAFSPMTRPRPSVSFSHTYRESELSSCSKEPFPLVRYLDRAVKSYDPVLDFFAERFRSTDPSKWENIHRYRERFSKYLKRQEDWIKDQFYGLNFTRAATQSTSDRATDLTNDYSF